MATADVGSEQVSITFKSLQNDSTTEISNARCVVVYEDPAKWPAQWKRNAYFIISRIKALETEAAGGNVQRILRGMAYKLFSALVDYNEKYRGMDEVLFLSSQFEATARVNFQTNDKDGTFVFSPYWIDSLAHISGFVLNANDTVNSKSRVYLSQGWESLRLLGQFSTKKTYRTYVKMQPEDRSAVMAGDVYIFEQDVIVGLIEGLKFRQVPRTMLNNLLPPTGPSTRRKESVVPIGIMEGAIPGTPKLAHSSPVKVPSASSIADRVGEIIAAEVGIAVDELSKETSFAHLGVDSLLSLEILGKLREHQFELPPTIFLEHETYGSLRAYLTASNGISKSRSDNPKATGMSAFAARESPHTTPSKTASTGSVASSETDASEINRHHEVEGTIREVIADEMGLSLNEFPLDAPLESLGMDSLMTSVITGSIREKIGLEVLPELLADNPSVKLLQGSTYDSERKLFLFPDGSGSATSYSSLPTLLEGLAVYGLSSPFLRCPQDWKCGISGVARLYITEIKRRQPRGPYLVGGWSVGGIIAYEAAFQLI